MRDFILLSILFSSLPFAIYRPYIGLLIWSWLSYMNPHQLGWATSEMPLVMIAAIVTIIMTVITNDKNKFPVSVLTLTWFSFVLWMCFTTLYLFNFSLLPIVDWQLDRAYFEWERMIKIQVMVLATILLITDRKKINALVWVIVFSIGFFGVKGGIFTIFTGGKYLVWGPPNSFIQGNNEIAFALLIIIPLVWFLYTETSRKYLRYFLLLSMLLMCVSIVGSYSRGALIGAAAMFLYLWFKGPNKGVGLIPIIVFALVGLYFMPAEWLERMTSIASYADDPSALGRINAWWFAYHLANDYPLTGGGFGTFVPQLFQIYAPNPDNVHDAHSIYFEVLGEHGYIGLLLFLLMWFITHLTGGNVISLCKGHDELRWANTLAKMLQVSLIGYAVGGAFLGLAYFDLPYHIMSMMVVLQLIVRKKLAEVAVLNEHAKEKTLVQSSLSN